MDEYTVFSGGLSSLPLMSDAETRSISAENFTGERGRGGMAVEGTGASCARDLGQGWKVSPCMRIEPGTVRDLADISGPGVIRHMWISGDVARLGPLSRSFIFRIRWDDQELPSVEVPIADFFASGWGEYVQNNSVPVSVNPNRGYNCFWPMPFGKRCRVSLENRHTDPINVFYQITYDLTAVPGQAAYFHAQFRRTNPVPYKDVHTIVDGIRGRGHYVGTSMAWGVNNNGWWGEGEIKFFMDGDGEFPTICGTGTEDYFGGAYNWDVNGKYVTYSTPYMGMYALPTDGTYRSQQRFGMYRWHLMDPLRFKRELKVTIQALGWRSGGRYLPLQDDVSSVAYWYQTLPTAEFPALPDRDYLEII